MLVLAYYKIRGLAQPIRFLLEHSGLEYEEKYYEFGPPPDHISTEWFEDKEKLGLDFPNIPYLFDGDQKLTQSTAIMQYIAEKSQLMPEGKDKYWIKMLEGHLMDIMMRVGFLSYDSEWEKKIKLFRVLVLGSMLKPLSKCLGNGKWIAGDKISYLDFMTYEAIYRLLVIFPDILKDYPNIQDHQKNIEGLDSIKKYFDSPRYIHRPLVTPAAKMQN